MWALPLPAHLSVVIGIQENRLSPSGEPSPFAISPA